MEYTDDQVFSGQAKAAPPKAKELSDAEVFGAPSGEAGPTGAETPNTVFGDIANYTIPGSSTVTFQDALGLLEQPGQGLYSMAQMGYGGVKALIRSMQTRGQHSANWTANRGNTFDEVFSNEYNDAVKDMPEWTPLTPSGAKITEKLGSALEAGLKAYGAAAYDLERPPASIGDVTELLTRRATGTAGASPLAGAVGEGIVGLAGLVAPMPGMKGRVRVDPIKTFEEKYPHTALAIDASQVGKIRLQPNERVMDAVNAHLDVELGLPAEQVQQLSTGDKLNLIVMKLGPDVSQGERAKLVRAYETRFNELQRYQDQVSPPQPVTQFDAEGKPVIPLADRLKNQAGWVKAPGGAWHPEARDILTQSLIGDGAVFAMHKAGNFPDNVISQKEKVFAQWADRSITNYLNKYAGTERDPLKDVRFPDVFDEEHLRWEDATDQIIKQKVNRSGALPGGKPDEVFHTIEGGNTLDIAPYNEKRAMAGNALNSYLRHVGDYMMEHVPPDRMPQYDLTRAVRETVANDVAQAKKMETAKADTAGAGTKLYKEYPDKMKWVEVGVSDGELPKGFEIKPDTKSKGVVVEYQGKPWSYYEKDPFGMPGERNGVTSQTMFGGAAAAKETVLRRIAEQALNNEGDVMGHCVGGYCDAVHAGETKIYSLRDEKNNSHVTIEVQMPHRGGGGGAAPIYEVTKPSIVQIKGKQNRAPVDAYIPYVQDFVKSSKMGVDGDLHNAKIFNIATDQGTYLPHSFMKDGQAAMLTPEDLLSVLKEPGYYTTAEIDAAAAKLGYAADPRGSTNFTYGPGRNQRGSIEVSGGGLGENAERVVKEAAGKAWTVQDPQKAAAQVDAVLENNYKAMEAKDKTFSLATIKAARRLLVAHDYDLQAALKNAGDPGVKAMLNMNIQHNATMMAKTRYDASTRKIFDKLPKDDVKNLEKIVRLRRIVQIDKYKGVGTVKHEGNITGPMADAALDSMRSTVKNYDFLEAKATAVFTEEKTNLKRLLDEGVIDDTTYNKMINLDYTPTEYLKFIDPETPIQSNRKDFPTSVRSSGIPFMGRGLDAAVNMDARLLLQDGIARVENRIARNKTLLALYKLAEESPDNGIVMHSNPRSVGADGEVKVVPQGWTSLGVRVEGKQKNVLMRDDFAQQFINRPAIGLDYVALSLGSWDITVASIIRGVSGSAVLRATATTYNPAFILAGLPMDIMHLWLATSKTYSPHLPMYMMQIGRDLMATAKDSFMRTGRWEQAMQEGMGPNFLTHESRASALNPRSLEPFLQKTRTAAAFFGDFQDMWVRLAHRERLIREGMPPAEATAAAVERLNYYRGGAMMKYIDTFIPYANISVNATSKVLENIPGHKMEMFSKVLWMTSAFTTAKLASMVAAPETDKAISTEDKIRSIPIPFGDDAFILDADGNKRYMYGTVRLDQTAVPFNAAVVAGLENAEYGTIPDGITSKAINRINPLTTLFPPSWQAYRAYTDNYDPVKDGPIYRGMKVKPEDEIRNVSHGQPTSAIAQMIGGATGLSPMGLEKAASVLLNTNNFYIQALGGVNKLMFGELNPREQASNDGELYLQYVPGLRSIVKLTTPGTEELKRAQKTELEMNSVYKKQIDGLEELMFKVEHQQADMKQVEEYIRQQPQGIQQYLKNHAKYQYSVDQVMKTLKASDGIPSRSWWAGTNAMRDEVRAQVFYNEWVSASPEDRRRMLGVANNLQARGTGYLSPSFRAAFAKEQQKLGTEQR